MSNIWQHFKENKKIVILETIAIFLFSLTFYGVCLVIWAHYQPI